MYLSFTKMHGLGNDFIVIDNTSGLIDLSTEQIKSLSDRKLGVGFDQLLLVENASVPDVEFDYRMYNADGGEVEHCGNGARCFARYLRERGLSDSDDIKVNTAAGIITLHIRKDDQVTVKMGVPEFSPDRIPFIADAQQLSYELEVDGDTVELAAVAIGNPHAVLQVADVQRAAVESLGAMIERHERFPNRVNVGFMQVIDSGHIRLRVFERGVGETRACGTGACAAAVIGQQKNLLDKTVIVTLPGGNLEIFWPGGEHDVEMTGPCTTVFEGQTKM